MTKEMVVSASSHDTRIAILEDGQVVEVYFEREKQYSLAGSIYKGRVTRILPGMQSAFVNIGLERDAFLYVSDFLEQVEEYDRVATTSGAATGEPDVLQARDEHLQPRDPSPAPRVPVEVGAPDVAGPEETSAQQTEEPAAETTQRSERIAEKPEEPAGAATGEERQGNRDRGRRFSRRGRRHRGRHHQGIPDSKFARRPSPQEAAAPSEPKESRGESRPEHRPAPILLPGESLAKYRDVTSAGSQAPSPEAAYEQAAQADSDFEKLAHRPDPMEAAFVEPAEHETPEEMLPDLMHTDEYQPEATYGLQQEEIISSIESPVTEASAESALDGRAPVEQDREERFLSIEEAVSAVREEKMIEDLEDEAAEIADADEAPSWAELEQRVDQMDQKIAEGEPDSPESGLVDVLSAAEQAPSAAEPIAPEGEASEPPAAATREGEAPQQASVRERPANPRFQRRSRWQARRQQRGGDRGDGGQRRQQRSFQKETPRPLIGDLLKEGQEIIVQVAKEPLGKKGARITSHIALPGRYIVFMPTLDHVGVSRKIASDEERHRLKRIIVEHTRNLSGGFIVRTAGEGATEEDLRQDVQFLVKLWAEIKAKAEKTSAPALLHHDLDLTLRTLRDQLSEEFQTIWVDNEQAYEQIVSLVQKFQPALINRVRLYSKDVPLFEETGVQEEINKALRPKVWLKSGGYIVINQTEALVAIDVNTGKFVGKSNRLEDTIVKTNVEAIQEIVRQIRLRDLGGIIVIDFIDMDERRNRQKVMSTLEEAMRADKAPSKILSFNEFGLLAITRKRVRQSLERTLCQPCAYCSGAGLVKSPATVSLEILAEARRMAAELQGKQVTLRVNPEVGKALKSRENDVLAALEEITGRGVIIRNDAAVHIENFYFD